MSFSSSLRSGRRRKFKSEINVVPYIDVMLVLLIIFMVTPPANNPSVINLPTSGKSALPPDDYIQIQIQPNAEITIGVQGKNSTPQEREPNRTAAIDRLRGLHDEHPEYPVLVAGDRDSKYDDVIQLISEAKKIGINRVALATK
jgi:biopolymer transport protein TolR